MQSSASGMVFWHEAGWRLFQTIKNYIRQRLKEYHYLEVKTPQLLNRLLWEKSGHWDNYREEMFITESEKHLLAIKPMSCPCHVEIFKQTLRSYRDLPLRLAEFGRCHRNEPSGTLHGLMRLRNFVQDDAHIFCRPDQVLEEAKKIIELTLSVYHHFGFHDITLALSTRPEKRIGDDQLWDKAEHDLSEALVSLGLHWQTNQGDGAFYGPKIDFSCHDCLGRNWQLGTLQLDYALPQRLGARYIAKDGHKKVPIMLHRAILGSIERFMGILLEHYSGKLPLWLAPRQVIILNISEKQMTYAEKLYQILQDAGIYVVLDLRNEKIGLKIREATLKKIPYLAIIGDREVETETLSIRTQAGERMGCLSIDQFLDYFKCNV